MSTSTNQLVEKGKHYAAPMAAVAGAFTLGAVLFAGHGDFHAAQAAVPTYGEPQTQQQNALTDLDRAMEAVTSKVTPSVVRVDVVSKGSDEEQSANGGGGGQQQGDPLAGLPPEFRRFFGQPGQGGQFRGQPQQPQLERGVGSGVIVSPDGYIVTNNHVVQGATQIRVTMSDRRIFTGKVVGTDKLTDIAVVKINATGLTPATWGDSTHLTPGQTVLAFGSPFGYLQFSVTRGIISAINRQDPFSTDARKPGAFIQTDAAINPGNSGGPLVNARGELIGINNAIISNTGSFEGVGFAIPSQIARSISTQLIEHGSVEHGYLGISMNDVTPANASFFNLKDASGAIVAQVTPGSPAANGGLRQGDVIRSLDGRAIPDGSALQVSVSEMRPGTHIALSVLRNGSPADINITVGSFKPNAETAANAGDANAAPAAQQTGKLGLAVADLTSDTRQQINAPTSVRGAVVENVRPGSPAEDAGLQPGDVILEVNRKAANNAQEFSNAIHTSPAGKDILLLVWSKGNASYRTLRTPENNG